MQHSEETAAAVAKAIEQVNEGWQRKFKLAINDSTMRKQLVDEVLKIQMPSPDDYVVLLNKLHRFIIEPFKDDTP